MTGVSTAALTVTTGGEGGGGGGGPSWEDGIAAFDDDARRAEQRRDAHEVNLTDLNARRRRRRKDPVTEDMLRERKAAEKRRAARKALEKGGTPEGPFCQFELFLGESRVWDGPGTERVKFPDGSTRCRGCGNIARLSNLVPTVCLDCHRSTCDHWPEVRGARPKPREQAPAAARKPARKPTRRERRAAG